MREDLSGCILQVLQVATVFANTLQPGFFLQPAKEVHFERKFHIERNFHVASRILPTFERGGSGGDRAGGAPGHAPRKHEPQLYAPKF